MKKGLVCEGCSQTKPDYEPEPYPEFPAGTPPEQRSHKCGTHGRVKHPVVYQGSGKGIQIFRLSSFSGQQQGVINFLVDQIEGIERRMSIIEGEEIEDDDKIDPDEP